ncbi:MULTISPECIES: Imm1 family immunity protein [Actinosynnema]|uniref:Imm1 family immunity protein n=1 Tax=Actinosynnema TaxID=40566 RepID=UPI0020A336B5|nr:Imm1 family immunity protein [Actinosynnema pretiosum]MCP2095581.1 hypothetical protein [Actinosynnema pretiosum]
MTTAYGEFDLAEWPDPTALVEQVRARNAARAATASPVWWQFTAASGTDPLLGVRGPTRWLDAGIDAARGAGALRWVDENGVFLPETPLAAGRGPTRWVDASGEACLLDPAHLVLPELVLEAVAEVAATKARPTCLTWREVPDGHSLVGADSGWRVV